MILRNTDAIFQLDTCDPSKYRCDPLTGYVRGFKKWICIRHRRWRLWGVCNTPLQPGTYGPSKNCPVFVPFGAVYGAYTIRPYNRVRARVQKMDLYTPPSVAYGGAYLIRPYNRVCVPLRNTDAISRLGTYGPSKNCLVFVPFGAVGWAYSIRPYNWVYAILRNTDAIFQLSTYDPLKYRRDLSSGGAGVFGRWGGGGYCLRGRWA